MQSLKRSCLLWALLYVVLGFAFSAAIYTRFPRPGPALGAGFGAAIFGWLGIAYLYGARYREARLVARALRGGRPEDGKKVAVAGRVGSAGETVESPLMKKRCVLYEYKILPVGAQQAGAWEGFHLAGARVDGPGGSVRLLAYPELAFPPENLRGKPYSEHAREYLDRAHFATMDVKASIDHMKTLVADDDGRIQYDINRSAPGEEFERMVFQEKVLEPGDPVVAIGTYSAAKGGLVPDVRAILHPIKIMKGDPAATLRKLYRGAVTDFFLGLGCLTPLLLAAAIALIVVPLTAIEQMLPGKDPSWPEIRLEQWLQQRVRPKTEKYFAFGEPALALPIGAAAGKLYAAGTTTPLSSASAERQADQTTEVSIFGPEEADRFVILRIDDQNRVRSLQVGGGDPMRDPDVAVESFRRSEEEIEGRVTYLTPETRMRAAFRAQVQGTVAEQPEDSPR